MVLYLTFIPILTFFDKFISDQSRDYQGHPEGYTPALYEKQIQETQWTVRVNSRPSQLELRLTLSRYQFLQPALLELYISTIKLSVKKVRNPKWKINYKFLPMSRHQCTHLQDERAFKPVILVVFTQQAEFLTTMMYARTTAVYRGWFHTCRRIYEWKIFNRLTTSNNNLHLKSTHRSTNIYLVVMWLQTR